VLIRPFNVTTEERAVKICARASSARGGVHALLEQVLAEFHGTTHKDSKLFNAKVRARETLAASGPGDLGG